MSMLFYIFCNCISVSKSANHCYLSYSNSSHNLLPLSLHQCRASLLKTARGGRTSQLRSFLYRHWASAARGYFLQNPAVLFRCPCFVRFCLRTAPQCVRRWARWSRRVRLHRFRVHKLRRRGARLSPLQNFRPTSFLLWIREPLCLHWAISAWRAAGRILLIFLS